MSEDWLPELRKDIPYFRELGINTISVSHSDATDDPRPALELLRGEGIHVLLTLLTDLRSLRGRAGTDFDDVSEPVDLQKIYSTHLVRKTLAIVDRTADCENVLGYSLDFEVMCTKGTTRIASLHRAAVRDVKRYLALRGGRQVPVGAAFPPSIQFWGRGLEYMAAGETTERIDFLGFACYSWVSKSDFKISGYQNLVESFGKYPVPMFFSEYGARLVFKARDFAEVECLYSSDMTGVFSGGFVETYSCSRFKPKSGSDEAKDTSRERADQLDVSDDDEGSDVSDDFVDDDSDEDEEMDDVGGYDVMRVEEDGIRKPKQDFSKYKAKLEAVAHRSNEEVFGRHEQKDYENWRCALVGPPEDMWLADPAAIPLFPLQWDEVMRR